jgi:hypothetical protein
MKGGERTSTERFRQYIYFPNSLIFLQRWGKFKPIAELEFQPKSLLDESELELLSLSFCFMQTK